MSFLMERCKGFTADDFYTWNASVTPRVPRLKQWDNMLKAMRKDQDKERFHIVPADAMPMLYIDSKKNGNVVMLKPEDLLTRKWPKASATTIVTEQDKFALEAEGYRESERPFVREGSLSLRTLGKSGFGRLIPPGECAITALVAGPGG